MGKGYLQKLLSLHLNVSQLLFANKAETQNNLKILTDGRATCNANNFLGWVWLMRSFVVL